MAEAVVDGGVFQQKKIARENAARPQVDSLTDFANAQVQIARAQAAGIEAQRQRILSEGGKSERLAFIRDRLRRLSQK